MTRGNALMICGTGSDVGKSTIVAGLCRLFARNGVRVAPFKAQNMSLNSYATPDGLEIARSQAFQAAAAMVHPEVAMNPLLLKPTGHMTSQLVVMGRPVGDAPVNEYRDRKHELVPTIKEALQGLLERYELVILEGAGGAAEINLLEYDFVNLPLALEMSIPAIVIGDIERGGVFASIYGTVALLPDELRSQLRGFVINKFRGDERLLSSGLRELERRCEIPCLGVLPHIGVSKVDGEDSLQLDQHGRHHLAQSGNGLDIAIIRFPHLANFTDFDPLAAESALRLRYVSDANALGDPDLVVLPGSKSTVEDLEWLRDQRLDVELYRARARGSAILGICAGFQMLGRSIEDDVESRAGNVRGLELIDSTTSFMTEKRTCQRRGVDRSGILVSGYEIHHGRTTVNTLTHPTWLLLDNDAGRDEEGTADVELGIWATSLHGIFENDEFRRAFLQAVADRRGRKHIADELSFRELREHEIERFAHLVEAHLDLESLTRIFNEARP